MASLKELITDAKVEALHAVVEASDQKYLCFTRLASDAWILSVSDGYQMWKMELDMDSLDTQRDLTNMTSIDSYLTRFRTSFTSAEIQVSQEGAKITMRVGMGAKALRFGLYHVMAAEQRTELQTILFRLAEGMTDLEIKLDQTTKQLESAQQRKTTASSAMPSLFDMDSNKKKTQPKVAPKTAGMSMVNPGSKKRKAAHGVMFD